MTPYRKPGEVPSEPLFAALRVRMAWVRTLLGPAIDDARPETDDRRVGELEGWQKVAVGLVALTVSFGLTAMATGVFRVRFFQAEILRQGMSLEIWNAASGLATRAIDPDAPMYRQKVVNGVVDYEPVPRKAAPTATADAR